MSISSTLSSQPPLVTLPKPERPSPLLNLAVYLSTVWISWTSTSPPPLSSVTPAWKQVACQWWKEQLLEVRKKWEAQQRSWCSNISEGRRETALSAVRTHGEASAPFMAPTPKRARLMGTITLSVGHCSTSVSTTRPPSSPPHQTSSATYPLSWRELVEQVKNPVPVVRNPTMVFCRLT